MADLRTNYQDDVLDASKNTARVYDLVDSNGTVVLAGVHLEDKTVYTTEGDDYGAADINTQNGKINELSNDLTDNNVSFKFGFDGTNYGYYKDGADTVTPFKQGLQLVQSVTGNGAVTRTFDCTSVSGYENLTVNDFVVDVKRIRTYLVQGTQSATSDYYTSNVTKSYTNGVLTISNLARTVSVANLYLLMAIESFDIKVCR